MMNQPLLQIFFDAKLSHIFCSAEQKQEHSRGDFHNSYNICRGGVLK